MFFIRGKLILSVLFFLIVFSFPFVLAGSNPVGRWEESGKVVATALGESEKMPFEDVLKFKPNHKLVSESDGFVGTWERQESLITIDIDQRTINRIERQINRIFRRAGLANFVTLKSVDVVRAGAYISGDRITGRLKYRFVFFVRGHKFSGTKNQKFSGTRR